jgi:Rrf2 family iron-sulfur cluster assembly transcriptional regulator
MMLTTKGRYAVMAMVDLARRQSNALPGPITLAQIAAQQSIGLSYLEQLFLKLRQGGLVKSVRGPGGGYELARPSNAILIADILEAVEESIKITRCNNEDHQGCRADKTRCITHNLWEGLGNHILLYFRSITLGNLCAGEVRADGLLPLFSTITEVEA